MIFIDGPPRKNHMLRTVYAGVSIPPPDKLAPPEGLVVVCIVANPAFDTAAIIYSESELNRMRRHEDDARDHQYYLVARERLPESIRELLSGAEKRVP